MSAIKGRFKIPPPLSQFGPSPHFEYRVGGGQEPSKGAPSSQQKLIIPPCSTEAERRRSEMEPLSVTVKHFIISGALDPDRNRREMEQKVRRRRRRRRHRRPKDYIVVY